MVTGGTGGVGRAIVTALAMEGVNQVITTLTSQSAEVNQEELQWADELARATRTTVNLIPVDLTLPYADYEVHHKAMERLGHVDILINNAGMQNVSALADVDIESFHALLWVNLISPLLLMRKFYPDMVARRWGRIINIASVHGLVGSAEKVPYVATKHGLVGATRALGVEIAGSGVTVNAVCPGFVETPMVEHTLQVLIDKGMSREQAVVALLKDKQPSGTFVPAAHIGELCMFLCSDAASAVTGAAWPMDGGWTAV